MAVLGRMRIISQPWLAQADVSALASRLVEAIDMGMGNSVHRKLEASQAKASRDEHGRASFHRRPSYKYKEA
jgi:hypothetical protein